MSQELKKPRVFVVHRQSSGGPRDRTDLTKAEEFGTLVVVFDGYLDLDDTENNRRRAGRIMQDLQFCERDIILLTGAKILNTMVVMEAEAILGHSGVLHLLTYSNDKGGRYVEHKMPILQKSKFLGG